MRRANSQNINSKTYWNGVYGTPEKRSGYAAQGTDSHICNGVMATPTTRFITALKYVKPGDKVIDFGCGVGVFTSLVHKTYPDCEVWGTDISSTAIDDNLKENPDIHYLHQYIGNQKDVPTNYFDLVFSGETVEHLDDPNDLFKEAYSALKGHGTLVVTTPLQDTITSEEHTWFYEPEDITKLYVDNGFEAPEFVYLDDMEHLFVIFSVGRKNES